MISSPITAVFGLTVTLMLRLELEAMAADENDAKTTRDKKVMKNVFIKLVVHWWTDLLVFGKWK
jgi:hypothetical protein